MTTPLTSCRRVVLLVSRDSFRPSLNILVAARADRRTYGAILQLRVKLTTGRLLNGISLLVGAKLQAKGAKQARHGRARCNSEDRTQGQVQVPILRS